LTFLILASEEVYKIDGICMRNTDK